MELRNKQFITTISDPSELLPIKIVSKDIHGTASIINNNTNYIDIANNYAQLYGGKVIYQNKQMNLRYTLDNLNNGDVIVLKEGDIFIPPIYSYPSNNSQYPDFFSASLFHYKGNNNLILGTGDTTINLQEDFSSQYSISSLEVGT